MPKMSSVAHIFSLIGVVGFAAGCGGSSSDPIAVNPPVITQPAILTFAEQRADAARAYDPFLAANGGILSTVSRTSQDLFPTTPSGASYAGKITATVGGDRLVADLDLRVSFDDQTVSSEAHAFVFEKAGAVSGDASGTGSVNLNLPDSVPHLTTTLLGVVNGQNTTLGIDGNFFDASGNETGATAGVVEGSIGSNSIMDGLYGAER